MNIPIFLAGASLAALILRTAWLYYADNNQKRMPKVIVPKTWAGERKITNIQDPLLVNIHTRNSFKD